MTPYIFSPLPSPDMVTELKIGAVGCMAGQAIYRNNGTSLAPITQVLLLNPLE